MAVTLSIFGVALAAFCVWLTVRIVNRREKWVKWMAAGLASPVLYVLSAGPSAWFLRQDVLPGWASGLLMNFYHPLALFIFAAPDASSPIVWYLKLFGYR